MKKVTYTEEIIEIIEALPAEYQSEVFALINSYVLRGCIPANPSPVAEAMFLSLKAKFERQAQHGQKKEEPQPQVAEPDYTDKYVEKIFTPAELAHGIPAELVRRAKEQGVNIVDIRRFFDFARKKGVIHKFRNCEFPTWQMNVLKALTDFAVQNYACPQAIAAAS